MNEERTRNEGSQACLDDRKRLEKFIKSHSDIIYGFIYHKVNDKDLTEDIFQETFVKVIRAFNGGQYREDGKLMSWVLKIAHNLVMDNFRRNKRMYSLYAQGDANTFHTLGDNTMNAEGCLIRDQINEDIHEMIGELPRAQQDVLAMRLYQDMTFKEISVKSGVSINTALGRMHYAISNLRKLAKKKEWFD
ncbi:RNA polymerase sigma factor [Sinomicrobium sp. M5D2P17]